MLEGQVAVVTGAGRGIGRGVALALAEAGAKVVVNDYGVDLHGRTPTSGPAVEVVEAITAAGGTAVANADSVAEWSGAEQIIQTAVREFGRIDILVTCAGILRDRMVFNLSEDDWDAVIAVHLKGTFNCLRHAAPLMRAQQSGRIITFSSGSGLFGNTGQANYGAAKSAIGGLTKVAARDLGKYAVTVNAIAPVAATRMMLTDEMQRARALRKQQGLVQDDPNKVPLEALKPEDVAPMVVFLASAHAANVNGQFFQCSGGAISLLSQPRAINTIYKHESRWSLDELDQLVPSVLTKNLTNPAPPRTA